ncbi:hypothetical protein IRJ41_023541, partial [Triplophysa rosa]
RVTGAQFELTCSLLTPEERERRFSVHVQQEIITLVQKSLFMWLATSYSPPSLRQPMTHTVFRRKVKFKDAHMNGTAN